VSRPIKLRKHRALLPDYWSKKMTIQTLKQLEALPTHVLATALHGLLQGLEDLGFGSDNEINGGE
jgi:hypothetical protein